MLKGASATVAATRSRLQRAFVVTQITHTQPLLVGLGVVIATMVTSGGATSPVADRIAEVELYAWSVTIPAAERASRIAAAVERVAAIHGARRATWPRRLDFFAGGLALSAIGLVSACPSALIVTRQVARALSWPLTSSPLLGLAIAAIVLVVASVAAWITARRAGTIDPLVALRAE